MTVYRPQPVDEVPTVCLAHWRMYRVKSRSPELQGTTHVVGWNIDAGDGRVSSPIVKWRPARRQIVTRSGRVYQLEGESGGSLDAHHVWSVWCRVNHIIGIEEVTEEFINSKPKKKHRAPKPKKRVLTSKE